MSTEDGIRKATENLDQAADAAPSQKRVDQIEFDTKDLAAEERRQNFEGDALGSTTANREHDEHDESNG
ncbi:MULTISPECIES: hypothetical protein [Brevibacterium]|uniref:Uncharacterized protein n=1 Tax=Brevibacterium aurantiacum TaxID=273384 RepID=A0A2A3Z9C3_BREAU|nr:MULTISPECIES: hypothetical protein [Brevibacterium]MBM6590304.1 hypothetical protein [Brevibacterium sp. RIT 803]PCC48113.1 hypothetical protein CIK64_02485 [Brevibacterium aurantiacum]TSI18580.1 hypothetical protein FO013_03200 [Brevibacterium aurantiacum]